MERNDLGAKIILGVFIIAVCCSWIIWLPLRQYLSTPDNENRTLAKPPDLTAENYLSFSNDFTAYYNDSFPFRDNLVTLNSLIDYYLFHTSSNRSVIVGKDGWLFYADKKDGNPIRSYRGEDLLTQEELEEMAENCEKQRDFLAEQNIEYVIFIAPNKERVYSEFMPDQYGKPAKDYRARQIYEYLKNHTDIRVVYPYEELMDVKEKLTENIYFKTDSHWNSIGAYVGASVLLKEIGINMPSIFSDQIEIRIEGDTCGDLAGMLNLNAQLKHTDKEYLVSGYDQHDMETLEADFFHLYRCHAENADSRTLYMIRDSFASDFVPYIGSQFNNSFLRHTRTYSYDDLQACNPDLVVFEVAERYVNKLKKMRFK